MYIKSIKFKENSSLGCIQKVSNFERIVAVDRSLKLCYLKQEFSMIMAFTSIFKLLRFASSNALLVVVFIALFLLNSFACGSQALFHGDIEEISCRDREHAQQFASLCAILRRRSLNSDFHQAHQEAAISATTCNLINRVSFYRADEDEPTATLVFVRNPLFNMRARLRWNGEQFQFANAYNKLCRAAHRRSIPLSQQSERRIDYRVQNGTDPSCGQELYWPVVEESGEDSEAARPKDWAKSDIVSTHFGSQRDLIANWEPISFGMVFSSLADAETVLRSAFAASPLYFAQPGRLLTVRF